MPPPVKAKREGAQAEIDSEEGAGMTPLPFLLGAALEAAHPRAANFVQFSLDLGDASELNIEALTTVVERAAQGLELVAAHLAIGTEESSRDLYSTATYPPLDGVRASDVALPTAPCAVPMHGQNRGHVLHDKDAAIADATEQSAGCILALVSYGSTR